MSTMSGIFPVGEAIDPGESCGDSGSNLGDRGCWWAGDESAGDDAMETWAK